MIMIIGDNLSHCDGIVRHTVISNHGNVDLEACRLLSDNDDTCYLGCSIDALIG